MFWHSLQVLTSSAIIVTSMYWQLVVQAGGGLSNQRIYASDAQVESDEDIIALTSCPMSKLQCKSVMLPERVQETTIISASQDETSEDTEHMVMDSVHYIAVANHCQGQNCFFDVEVIFTTGVFDLDSIIY